MPLHPRHRIDIGLPELSWGLAATARGLHQERCTEALEEAIDPAGAVLATLSVRSAFDLLLTALALPSGSEVLLSALTIPDMPRLLKAHGLVPVPVDIEPTTLAPSRAALSRAISPRSRMLVVAQLLGARVETEKLRAFARERGLLFVNDDAQGFTGLARLREESADISMYSFGTIKTATCLGGGLVRVGDPTLRALMREIKARWPVQPTAEYARKLALFMALLPPRQPRAYTLFAAACERFGPGLDPVVMGLTRGFPANDIDGLLARLRRQPCASLLALMRWRLAHLDEHRVARRRAAGESLKQALSGEIEVLGAEAPDPTHWLFAVLLDDPDRFLAPLRRAGFDAARGATSLAPVAPPADRPELAPGEAHRVMDRVLFLPVYPEIPESDRARIASELLRFKGNSAGAERSLCLPGRPGGEKLWARRFLHAQRSNASIA